MSTFLTVVSILIVAFVIGSVDIWVRSVYNREVNKHNLNKIKHDRINP